MEIEMQDLIWRMQEINMAIKDNPNIFKMNGKETYNLFIDMLSEKLIKWGESIKLKRR